MSLLRLPLSIKVFEALDGLHGQLLTLQLQNPPLLSCPDPSLLSPNHLSTPISYVVPHKPFVFFLTGRDLAPALNNSCALRITWWTSRRAGCWDPWPWRDSPGRLCGPQHRAACRTFPAFCSCLLPWTGWQVRGALQGTDAVTFEHDGTEHKPSRGTCQPPWYSTVCNGKTIRNSLKEINRKMAK